MVSTSLLLLGALSSASAQGMDMSAEFAKLKTCQLCTKAGYGWCSIKRKCGGFANKECGIGERYVTHDFMKPKKSLSPPPPPTSEYFTSRPAPSPPRREQPPRGTDMRAMFAKLRDCTSCVGAGYGWCPMQRKCGGFANQQCGVGPNYVAADAAPSLTGGRGGSGSAPKRNGLWESKSKNPTDAPPASVVPQASPPPPASLIYAGPVAPPATQQVAVTAEGTLFAAATAASSNASTPLDPTDLMALPQQQLVDKVIELQAAVAALQAAKA